MVSKMSDNVAELYISLDIAKNNASIHEREGNTLEADNCRKNVEAYQRSIACLEHLHG